MQLGFLGTGTIATCVAHALAPRGHQITVSERSAQNAAALAEANDNIRIAPNADVVHQADVIFLGLMPDVAETLLPALPFRKGQCVISFMADMPLDRLAKAVTPATADSILIPFPAVAKTRAPFLNFPASQLCQELFAEHDLFTLQNAQELQTLLAAQALLSPVTQMLAETAAWSAAQGANHAKAERFLRRLISASLTADDSATLLKALDTPGGYNARLRDALTESYTALSAALSKL